MSLKRIKRKKAFRCNGYCILRINEEDVLVDFCDVPKLDLAGTIWTVAAKGNTKYVTSERIVDGKRMRVYLHRVILDFPELVIDHIDRNGLNNRRSNLRLCTAHGNWVNSGPRTGRKGKTSKYKGVSLITGARKWRAAIMAHGRLEHIGVYDTPEEGARAYDVRARLLFGPTAYLNCSEFDL